MIVQAWVGYGNQFCKVGKQRWAVSRLIELSKTLPVQEMPIDALNVDIKLTDDWRLRDMASHFNAILNSDLSFPIILDEDGVLMDGRHRIVKALAQGEKSIKFVKFDKNPYPDSIES